jgi:hypothetical protein
VGWVGEIQRRWSGSRFIENLKDCRVRRSPLEAREKAVKKKPARQDFVTLKVGCLDVYEHERYGRTSLNLL